MAGIGSCLNPPLSYTARMRKRPTEMGKRMDTTLMETDANDVMEMSVLEHWRSTWTDLSRTEEVTAQGPSFVLWHSDTSVLPRAFHLSEARPEHPAVEVGSRNSA